MTTNKKETADGGTPQIWANTAGWSVARSLATWCAQHSDSNVTLVSGYVSLRGLLSIVPALRQRAAHLRPLHLLIGVAPHDEAMVLLPMSEEPAPTLAGITAAPDAIPNKDTVRQLCRRGDRALYAELNTIPATRRTGLLLEDLARLLDNHVLECRRLEDGFLHSKAAVADGPEPQVIVGSANLTYTGLHLNQELSVPADASAVGQAIELVERWWQRALPYDLGACVRARRAQYPAELILLRMLKEAYGGEVDASPSDIGLVGFQRDGVAQLLAMIDRYGGALDADAVGLGKTLAGGDIARVFLERGQGPVVIVCLASLVPMWKRYLTDWRLRCDIISYEQISNHYKDVVDHGHTWPRYGLIICDEAHQLRNPLTLRMLAIRSLIDAHTPRPKVLLLTATPVNNGAGDLLELLLLIDPSLEEQWQRGGTFSRTRLSKRSATGQRLTSYLADPITLCAVEKARMSRCLRERMLRRDHTFLATHYPPSPYPGRFPTPEHKRVTYQLSPAMRRLFADVIHAVGYTTHLPPDLAGELHNLVGESRPPSPLTLAVYQRERYQVAEHSQSRNPALLALIRILLLKRLESSPAACLSTLRRIREVVVQALADLDRGIVRLPRHHLNLSLKQSLARDSGTDLEPEDVDALLAAYATIPETIELPASRFDSERLRADLDHDLEGMTRLIADAEQAVTDDSKKAVLRDILFDLVNDPRSRKIIIFSSARTTTADLGPWLEHTINTDPRLASLRGRIANLGSAVAPDSRQTQDIVARFDPHHNRPPHQGLTTPPPRDDFDVLIATDIMALGGNMQDAACCVHYDLTWNPQILGQRFGRIDRLGSHHEIVTCWTVQPDAGLDVALHLMEIIARKAQIAAATVGLPTPLYAGSPTRAVPDPTSTEPAQLLPDPDMGDRQHAWLGTALRTPALRQALDDLPSAAGGTCTGDVATPSVLFCFRLVHPGASRAKTAFVRVSTADRDGAYSLDPQRCLTEPHLDPSDWIRNAGRPNLPSPSATRTPMPSSCLKTFHSLIDSARALVAQHNGISKSDTVRQVELVAWLHETPHRKGS
ncbi:SNF2-related protein [Kitasatospora sp. NPDC096147]|uniref:SNF2-related protein n=1 Tax=Kitasatospora sp. NPDC096147 TaxID=3364093 RepID=UPI0038065409